MFGILQLFKLFFHSCQVVAELCLILFFENFLSLVGIVGIYSHIAVERLLDIVGKVGRVFSDRRLFLCKIVECDGEVRQVVDAEVIFL